MKHSVSDDKKIYIEKERATGWLRLVLRMGGIDMCSSKNEVLPRSLSDFVQTDDLVKKKTFTTCRNPDYEDITIAPGLKLEYPVYDGSNPDPVAKMTKSFTKWPNSPYYQYTIYAEDEVYRSGLCPSPVVSIGNDGFLEPSFLECLPENDVCVSIYPDDGFVYDPSSPVEERYIVCIAEQHLQWLPHVFHAYCLGRIM